MKIYVHIHFEILINLRYKNMDRNIIYINKKVEILFIKIKYENMSKK